MAEIIFGIDHGNGNMKGENVCFPCGLVRYVCEPGRFMNEDILEYQGTYYTLSDTKMPFKADKTVDDDYFILTLYALAMEARNKGITLTGKDVVLGVGLPPADYGQQATSFKKYFLDHAKHGISFKMNGKSVNFYLKDVFVSPQNFAAVMCFKASLLKKYRTVSEIMNISIEQRFSRGIFLTPKLLGYDKDEDGNLVINESEADTVRLCYYLFLSGFPTSEIAEILMDLGRKTKLGNTKWTGSTVVNVLRNERHCGDVLSRKTFTPNYLDHKSKKNNHDRNQYRQTDHHEAIVSREIYGAAQKMLDASKYMKKGYMVFMTPEQRRRHTAKPGLSGLAQVNGRNAISWEDKIEWDLKYIEKVSLVEDIKIIFKTVEKAFVKQEGITEEDMATAEDLGDYLLRNKKVDKEKYDQKQKQAKMILNGEDGISREADL